MGKKTIEKCDYWEYLPSAYKRTRTLELKEKNLLAVLIFHYYANEDYRKEHDGWFYAATKTLEQETKMDDNTIARAKVNLRLKGLLFTRKGENVVKIEEKETKIARNTHYHFSHQVIDNLIVTEDFDEDFRDTRQEKIRQEETRREESSRVKIRRDETRTDISESISDLKSEEQEVLLPLQEDKKNIDEDIDNLPF